MSLWRLERAVSASTSCSENRMQWICVCRHFGMQDSLSYMYMWVLLLTGVCVNKVYTHCVCTNAFLCIFSWDSRECIQWSFFSLAVGPEDGHAATETNIFLEHTVNLHHRKELQYSIYQELEHLRIQQYLTCILSWNLLSASMLSNWEALSNVVTFWTFFLFVPTLTFLLPSFQE